MATTQAVSPWAHGIAVFAGVVMIIGGGLPGRRGPLGHRARQVPRRRPFHDLRF